MPRLVLLNGAPGVGKSTIAALVAERQPNAVAVDVDEIRLGLPDTDPAASGRVARERAVELVREHLGAGRDVVIGHHLAKADFIEELAADAGDLDAEFVEILLMVPAGVLRQRHVEDGRTVTHSDATRLIDAVHALALVRPRAELVDAGGAPEQTAANVLAALAHAAAEDAEA